MKATSIETPSRFQGQGGNAGSTLLAVVSSLAMMLLVLEAGFRVLPIPLAGPVVTINEPDATLGWIKRHGESTRKKTSEFDITFRINALGLRDDDDLTLEKPAGVQRVLVVGDSFVLGYTVDRPDLFVDQVERALLADGKRVQVLNGGTEGYSTDQELLWLRTRGLAFQPDVVVLCFYQNDVYMNGQTEYVDKQKPRFPAQGDGSKPEPMPDTVAEPIGFWARHTAIGGLFHNLGTSLRYGRSLQHQSGDTVMPIEDTVGLTHPPEALRIDDCWARTATALRGFKATCEQQKLKLLLVTIPSREQVHDDALQRYLSEKHLDAGSYDPNLPTRKVTEISTGLGIDVLDPLPAFRKAGENGTPLYFVKDWHINPDGNRVLADSLYERLCEEKYLGGATSSKGLAAIDSNARSSRGIPTWVYVVSAAWLLLSVLYMKSYRDERRVLVPFKIAALIGSVVLIVWLFGTLVPLLGPRWGRYIGLAVVLFFLGFLFVKSRSKLGIIREVYGSFVRNGHWYMIPLLVAMLTVGSLLVVASSSPFIAPFIYTLF